MALPLIPLIASMGTGQGLAWTTAAGVAGGMAVHSLTKDKEAEAKKQEESLKEQQQKDNETFQNALNDEANQKEFLNAMQNNKSLQESYNNSLNPPQNTPKEENEVEATTKTLAPKRYRNTGISLFDDKENMNILEAFLAKQLGVDVRRIDIDMNLNANVKRADVGKARGDIATQYADMKTLLDSAEHYEDVYQKQDNSYYGANAFSNVGRYLNYKSGGIFGFLSNEDNKKILTDNQRDEYAVARTLAGGAGKVAVQHVKDAKDLYNNTLKSRGNYLAAVDSVLDQGVNNLNEKYHYTQSIGVPMSESDTLKMELINQLRGDLRRGQGGEALGQGYSKRVKALGILNEKGDGGVSEAIKLLREK